MKASITNIYNSTTEQAFPVFESEVDLNTTKLLDYPDAIKKLEFINFSVEIPGYGSGKIFLGKPSNELLGKEESSSSNFLMDNLNLIIIVIVAIIVAATVFLIIKRRREK